MNCQGGFLYNQFLMNEVSQYLSYKKAKTFKEKEFHSSLFIDNNKHLEKEFCYQKCTFRQSCQQKGDKNGKEEGKKESKEKKSSMSF